MPTDRTKLVRLPVPSPEPDGYQDETPGPGKPLRLLTDRERQIMTLVSEGLSNKEIGRRLNVSDGTIKVHLHHIFQKLDIANRTVLAADAGDPFTYDRMPVCND